MLPLMPGIFICQRCAIIHRKIGTHITKTKSLTLDKWSPEQIAVFALIRCRKLIIGDAFYGEYKVEPEIQSRKQAASNNLFLWRYNGRSTIGTLHS